MTTPPPCLISSQILLPFEGGLSLLAEGLDSLIRVPGDEHAADRLALDRQSEVEGRAETLRDGELGVPERHARTRGDLRRVSDRSLAARGGVRQQPVDQPGLAGLRWIHRGRVDDQVESLRKTHEPGQALSAARPGEEAQADLG